MSRIVKPAYGDSGVGSSAKYKASTSGYNNHSGSGRYSSPGRKRTGGGTGSGGGKHFKKKHFKKNKNKNKDDKPQGTRKMIKVRQSLSLLLLLSLRVYFHSLHCP